MAVLIDHTKPFIWVTEEDVRVILRNPNYYSMHKFLTEPPPDWCAKYQKRWTELNNDAFRVRLLPSNLREGGWPKVNPIPEPSKSQTLKGWGSW